MGNVYESHQTSTVTDTTVTLVAITGYIAIAYESTTVARSERLDVVVLDNTLSPRLAVSVNGVAKDDSIQFVPIAAVAQDHHRVAVLGTSDNGTDTKLVVRRYFW